VSNYEQRLKRLETQLSGPGGRCTCPESATVLIVGRDSPEAIVAARHRSATESCHVHRRPSFPLIVLRIAE
jgi:hypothetical protein